MSWNWFEIGKKKVEDLTFKIAEQTLDETSKDEADKEVDIEKVEKIVQGIIDIEKDKADIKNKVNKLKEIILDEGHTNIWKLKKATILLNDKDSWFLSPWQIEWMKELFSENKSMQKTANILGIGMMAIRYHLVDGEKEKIRKRNLQQRKNRKNDPVAWDAFKVYQKNYQRKYRKIKKLGGNENEKK